MVLGATLGAGLALAADAGAASRPLRAQGRVLAPDGSGEGDWPVELIATQRFVELKRFKSGGDVAVVGKATTDAQGYFSFDLERARGYHYWFLRFSAPAIEDPVVWQAPEDMEITREVKRNRSANVEVRLRHHPDWAEVERRIAVEGGPSTPRGRILRTLGLPEKDGRDPVSGSEEWWYFTRGVMYSFGGPGGPASHKFEPVTPPGAAQSRRNP